MIHCLPITTAHDTSVNKNHPSTPQIVTCKDPIPYSSPHKEGNMPRSLNLPNTFPREDNGLGVSQLIVKRADIKSPILCQLPSHTITIHSGRKICTQSAEKFIHNTHFPIIWCLDLLGSFGSCQDRLRILYLVGGTGLESMCLAFGP